MSARVRWLCSAWLLLALAHLQHVQCRLTREDLQRHTELFDALDGDDGTWQQTFEDSFPELMEIHREMEGSAVSKLDRLGPPAVAAQPCRYCRQRLVCQLRLIRMLINMLEHLDASCDGPLNEDDHLSLMILKGGEWAISKRIRQGRLALAADLAIDVGEDLGFNWQPYSSAYEKLATRFTGSWYRRGDLRCMDDYFVLMHMKASTASQTQLASKIHFDWAVGYAWGMARETLFPDVVDYINPELVHGNVQLTAANAELVQLAWALPAKAFREYLKNTTRKEYLYSPAFVAFGLAWNMLIVAKGKQGRLGFEPANGAEYPSFRSFNLEMAFLGEEGLMGPPVEDPITVSCAFAESIEMRGIKQCLSSEGVPLKAMLRGKGPLSAAVVGGELLLSVTIRPDGAYRAVGSLGKRPRLLPSPLMRWSFPYTGYSPVGWAGFKSERLRGSGYDGIHEAPPAAANSLQPGPGTSPPGETKQGQREGGGGGLRRLLYSSWLVVYLAAYAYVIVLCHSSLLEGGPPTVFNKSIFFLASLAVIHALLKLGIPRHVAAAWGHWFIHNALHATYIWLGCMGGWYLIQQVPWVQRRRRAAALRSKLQKQQLKAQLHQPQRKQRLEKGAGTAGAAAEGGAPERQQGQQGGRSATPPPPPRRGKAAAATATQQQQQPAHLPTGAGRGRSRQRPQRDASSAAESQGSTASSITDVATERAAANGGMASSSKPPAFSNERPEAEHPPAEDFVASSSSASLAKPGPQAVAGAAPPETAELPTDKAAAAPGANDDDPKSNGTLDRGLPEAASPAHSQVQLAADRNHSSDGTLPSHLPPSTEGQPALAASPDSSDAGDATGEQQPGRGGKEAQRVAGMLGAGPLAEQLPLHDRLALELIREEEDAEAAAAAAAARQEAGRQRQREARLRLEQEAKERAQEEARQAAAAAAAAEALAAAAAVREQLERERQARAAAQDEARRAAAEAAQPAAATETAAAAAAKRQQKRQRQAKKKVEEAAAEAAAARERQEREERERQERERQEREQQARQRAADEEAAAWAAAAARERERWEHQRQEEEARWAAGTEAAAARGGEERARVARQRATEEARWTAVAEAAAARERDEQLARQRAEEEEACWATAAAEAAARASLPASLMPMPIPLTAAAGASAGGWDSVPPAAAGVVNDWELLPAEVRAALGPPPAPTPATGMPRGLLQMVAVEPLASAFSAAVPPPLAAPSLPMVGLSGLAAAAAFGGVPVARVSTPPLGPLAPPQQQVRRQQGGADREAQELGECAICWDAPRQTLLAPCGHKALCLPCTQALMAGRQQGRRPECPLCRREVASFIDRVFNA